MVPAHFPTIAFIIWYSLMRNAKLIALEAFQEKI
jgi:hypothetical protein